MSERLGETEAQMSSPQNSGERQHATWWLSFADGRLPAGTQFLGVAIVKAADFGSAVMLAHLLKINPGGEVQGVEMPPQVPDDLLAPWLNRLLTRGECERCDAEVAAALPQK